MFWELRGRPVETTFLSTHGSILKQFSYLEACLEIDQVAEFPFSSELQIMIRCYVNWLNWVYKGCQVPAMGCWELAVVLVRCS